MKKIINSTNNSTPMIHEKKSQKMASKMDGIGGSQKISVQEKFLHAKFVQFGKSAKEWTRKCILLLPEIEKYEIWKKKGFSCIYEYAAKLAGMSRETVNEGLRVLHAIEDKPALQKVAETKGINAVKPVLAVATAENADFWAEKAMSMSKNTLEIYVKEIRNLQPEVRNEFLPRKAENGEKVDQQAILDSENSCQIFGDLLGNSNCEKANVEIIFPENSITENQKSAIKSFEGESIQVPKKLVAMQLDPQILAQLEKLKGENGDWNDLMKQLLQMREEHLEEQKPESIKTDSRYITAKIDRYVTSRTNGQCAFPGCNKPAEIKHHTQRFALEKVHDADRIYGLCKAHERIAHLGLIENEDLLPKLWKVRKTADITTEIGKAKYKIDQVVQKFRVAPG